MVMAELTRNNIRLKKKIQESSSQLNLIENESSEK